MNNRVMWATTAIHQLGDISRDKGDFCIVGKRPIDGNYIGAWITGFGFIQVKFPVATTKTLTKEQRSKYDKANFALNGIVFKPKRTHQKKKNPAKCRKQAIPAPTTPPERAGAAREGAGSGRKE